MTDKKEAPKKETSAKVERATQNGIVRPAEGTKTGSVWAHSDTLSQATGKPATRADVLAACEKEGINKATAATQYGRWCKFNGVAKVVAPKAEKKEAPTKEAETETEADDAEEESEEGFEE